MARWAVENIQKAARLHRETRRAGLSYGCIEVAIQALSGSDMHLVDLLNKPERKGTPLQNLLARKGLEINWRTTLSPQITPEAFTQLLEGDSPLEHHYPQGKLAGHLCVEMYPPESPHNHHANAILPRDVLPREIRKTLKRNDAYLVIDTNQLGMQGIPVENLIRYFHMILDRRGQWQIAEMRHRVPKAPQNR